MLVPQLWSSVALATVLASLGLAHERRIEQPAQARPSAILVFVDTATAWSDGDVIAGWRAALDRDGWASWLLVDEWRGAREVRALIEQIAREHPSVLIIGLALSIALMGLAASFIARLLGRYRWIAYVGLAIILYVALKMIWEGWHEVGPAVAAQFG